MDVAWALLSGLSGAGTLALVLWLCRNLIITRLTKSVEFEFNFKLEQLRTELREKEERLKADLRLKETEIASLRSGAMTAMASRQVAVDKRKLEAVDQLWAAVFSLGPAKAVSSVMATFKFEALAEEAVKQPQIKEMFTGMFSVFDANKIDGISASKAQPYVTPMAWALYRAYSAIAMQAVIKLTMIKHGVAMKDLLNKTSIADLVKAALPHQSQFVDQHGDAGYHYLLDELEGAMLAEFKKMLAGEDSDKASVDQARKILALSSELIASQSNAEKEIASKT